MTIKETALLPVFLIDVVSALSPALIGIDTLKANKVLVPLGDNILNYYPNRLTRSAFVKAGYQCKTFL